MANKSFIWITTQKEFIHNYSDAPVEVNYLKHPHRHMFKFKVYLEVGNNKDRDVEFIMFKHEVEYHLKCLHKNIKSTSCEKLSDYLYDNLKKDYPKRTIHIEVSEDGENGVLKQYD